jgi:hypothetical protein
VSWWFVERYGFSEKEKDRVKEWLGKTLIPLVTNRQSGEKLELEEFLYFKESGSIEVVRDEQWRWMMHVAEALGSIIG